MFSRKELKVIQLLDVGYVNLEYKGNRDGKLEGVMILVNNVMAREKVELSECLAEVMNMQF